MHFRKLVDDRVGTSLKKCPTTPFPEEAPQSSAGPRQRLHEARAATKGGGPSPGRGGAARRGRVKRSGASRPRGREAPGKQALGPRGTEGRPALPAEASR